MDTFRGVYETARDEKISINELCHATIENKETLAIHVGLKNEQPLEALGVQLFNGFRAIASYLETHSDLKNVREVVAYSWIVDEHPDALEKLGFTIDREHTHPLREKLERKYKAEKAAGALMRTHVPPVAELAYMTKEDFLQRYHS